MLAAVAALGALSPHWQRFGSSVDVFDVSTSEHTLKRGISNTLIYGHDAPSLEIYRVERGCIAVGLATQEAS
ncbi:hypothetical protein L210DRAFT_562620 [Boletus edulis BED1]|uniref:Uncharacterized protein n=1 Tax=Boletus edulis BED1 TaxID=1328754 RepID=A0AAD4BC46_BOLED|nr:hypothetical protein L210DRAFT_562620 [Boletus edulis BED1]